MEVTLKDIQKNLQNLPKDLYQEVNDFLEFLKLKYRTKENEDWSRELAEDELKSIENGIEDVENGRVFSHGEVKEKITEYLHSKGE